MALGLLSTGCRTQPWAGRLPEDVAVDAAIDSAVPPLCGAPKPPPVTCHHCGLDFLPGIPVATGDQFVLGDFNGDRVMDVVGSTGGGSVLLLGNGDGTFRTSPLATPSLLPVAAADLDGDGHFDLMVAGSYVLTNTDSGDFKLITGLSVLRGVGDGSFRAPLPFPIDNALSQLVAADLDGDGSIDLASVEQPLAGGSLLAVRWGAGDGTFSVATPIEEGAGVTAIVAGDFSGDCRPDLGVTLSTGRAGALVYAGARRFTLGDTQPVLQGPWSLAAGDLNEDGVLDLVVGDNTVPSTAHVDVLLGQGDARFAPSTSYESGFQSTGVAIADLDGDGHLDVVLGTVPANGTGPDTPLWMLVGNGKGTLAPPVSFGRYGAITQVAVADFNGDGRSDVLFTNDVLLAAAHH